MIHGAQKEKNIPLEHNEIGEYQRIEPPLLSSKQSASEEVQSNKIPSKQSASVEVQRIARRRRHQSTNHHGEKSLKAFGRKDTARRKRII